MRRQTAIVGTAVCDGACKSQHNMLRARHHAVQASHRLLCLTGCVRVQPWQSTHDTRIDVWVA